MAFSIDYLQALMLLAVRHTAVLWITPAFNVRSLPMPVRLSLGILLSFAVLPPGSAVQPSGSEARFIFAMIGEVALGLLLGFAVLLVFTAVRGAGALADMQIGLTSASLFDPSAQAGQSTPLETLANLSGTLLFFCTDAHHQFLFTLQKLARVLPAGDWAASAVNVNAATGLIAAMLETTVRLALPVLAVTIVADVGLALGSRMVPQLQPFFFGAPLKTLIGLGLLIVAFPVWGMAVIALFDNLPRQLWLLFAR